VRQANKTTTVIQRLRAQTVKMASIHQQARTRWQWTKATMLPLLAAQTVRQDSLI
jgi:hypothetical protein